MTIIISHFQAYAKVFIMLCDISRMLCAAGSVIRKPRRIKKDKIEPIGSKRSVLEIADDVRPFAAIQIKIRISLSIRKLALHPFLPHSQVEAARIRLLNYLVDEAGSSRNTGSPFQFVRFLNSSSVIFSELIIA